MLSKKATEYFVNNNYSFEEIEWIKLWIKQAKNWEVVSKQEMNNFIKIKLFSKFKVDV